VICETVAKLVARSIVSSFFQD